MQELQEENITGDDILSMAEPDVRLWFQEHPKCYKASVYITLFVVVLIWPYFLFKNFNNDNNKNNDYAT